MKKDDPIRRNGISQDGGRCGIEPLDVVDRHEQRPVLPEKLERTRKGEGDRARLERASRRLLTK